MGKKLSMDINFTDHHAEIFGDEDEQNTCGACGRRYHDNGMPVTFNGYCPGKEGDDGVFYFIGALCSDCILSSPAGLAAKIRARAGEILRRKNIRRNQRVEAERMIDFVVRFEKVGSLKDLPGGIMAVKIGEAYREIEKPRPQRNRKAA